ncbi:response regulator [Aequorivita todarodis]|uniref:response regulator n=1 Tax=Aequorivita todarodis TaxID=2036821 RepID=UPI002350FED5|nr:response regulator [Aequorivita todarodis]MDC8000106.1 response regulator [Aequorivita todarodis]
MEKRTFNILIVEDHPILMESYKSIFDELEEENSSWKFNIKNGDTCDIAIFILENQAPMEGFDLVFLDFRIPPSTDGKYISGEDIGLYIRKKFPQTKIMFATSESHQLKIQSIFRSLDPEGFIYKGDSSREIFMTAIKEILNEGFYYSKSVLQTMRTNIAMDLFLDEWDRKILFELERGTKTTHLPQILPLSLSSVGRRKRKLKELFEVEGDDDRELIEKARELGFI